MTPETRYAALVRAVRNHVRFPPGVIKEAVLAAGRDGWAFIADTSEEARPEPAPGVPCECGRGIWVTRSSCLREDGRRRVTLHCGACGRTEHVSKVTQRHTTPTVDGNESGGTLMDIPSTEGSR
jgi:hypothetical protein